MVCDQRKENLSSRRENYQFEKKNFVNKPLISVNGNNKLDSTSYFVRPFDSTDFIFDSGSTDHHIASSEKFCRLGRQTGTVTVANGNECQVLGTGDAQVSTPKGVIRLEGAKFTPDFGVNLISVRQLTKLGYSVIFDEDMARVCLNGSVVMTAEVLSFNAIVQVYLVISSVSSR